jgi:UDP-glucose 4-epimerase
VARMTVVVTGGAGFIGANLVRALRTRPEIGRMVVVDDLSTGARENLVGVEDVEFVEGSVCDPDLIEGAVAGADAIVHLAASPSVPRSLKDPVGSHEANATGTVRVLEAARAAGGVHTVVASSSAVYGSDPTLPKHEGLPTVPVSPYAASKLATEGYAAAYQASFGMPTLAFRFFNVFGPLQPAGHAYAAVIPAFLDAALAGTPLSVHGDGKQSRDFTTVASVCTVLVDAVLRRVTAEGPVNLAFGTRRTLLEVIAVIEQILGHDLDVVHTDPRPGDVRHSQADQTRLRQLFPDVAAQDFEEGLRETIDWFRSNAQ